MQVPPTPTEDDEAEEAYIPAERVRNGPNVNLNRTFTVRRKAGKRILPWDLPVDEIQLASPRPGDEDEDEDEDIRETKRPRLREPFSASTDEDTSENKSQATTVAIPLLDDAAVDHHLADSDPVMDMHPKAWTTRERRCWTSEENAKLTSAVTKTRKKKRGKELKIDWVTIAVLVPGRTKLQCRSRWREAFNIDATTARAGKWTADEDKKLRDGVREHGGKNWKAIAAQVPGRTQIQCSKRWWDTLVYNIDPTLAGKWTVDEDRKLKDVVGEHGGKNWKAIAALVPGRTKNQCRGRWHKFVR
jgi:hypothetical protein